MASSRKVVIGFGRFNPPTTGHAEHIKFIADTAHRLGAEHIVYASASQDHDRNPLPFMVKVSWLQRLFPQVTFNRNQNIRTPFDAFKQCAELGYTHIFVVVSGERVPEFKRFERYFAPVGSPQYKKDVSIPAEYTVVDSGRSMDTGARMSATKLRGFAKNGDFKSFRRGVPTHDNRLAELLYKDVRKFMGIHEKFNITQGQFAVGLFELHTVVTEDHVKVGDKVHAGFGQRGGAGFSGVVDRIDGNYVYVNIGKDKFGDRIIKAPHSHVMKEAKDDYTFDATAIEHNKVVDQMWGLAKHEFPHAVTMFRKKHPHATISFMNKSGTVVKVVKSGENFKEAVGRVHGLTAQDQLRGARIIYRALTNTDAPRGMVNPIDLINTAIPEMLKKKHTPEGWHIAGQMLTKAREQLGIDWDLNKINSAVRRAMRIQESETQVDEAETPTATKPPSETERLRTTQQQELIALKTRQANAMMAAKLRDVQMKAREAQAKANQPKPAAKPAS